MRMAETLQHHLRVEPYDYQKEGILAGLRWHRFLIGDEPGLGKTLQSIGVVDCANAYPCLVICPSSLKINWQREFEKFTDKHALVLDNSVLTTWPYLLKMGMQQVTIVNYESLRKYFVWDIKGGSRGGFRLKDVVFTPDIKLFKSIIIDESHRVKDPSAQQTIFAWHCRGKGIPHLAVWYACGQSPCRPHCATLHHGTLARVRRTIQVSCRVWRWRDY